MKENGGKTKTAGVAETALYIDADGCPVKEEAYRVAERNGLNAYVVSNRQIRVPHSERVRQIVVGNRFDAADDWIAERIGELDVVITADILLAERCIKKGAFAITPKGLVHDENSIGAALATRELLEGLRQMGEMTGGPPPMTQRDKSYFAMELERVVAAIRRLVE